LETDQMDFCTCIVELAGENGQVVHRDKFHPLSWPELDVLQALHGEGSVQNAKPFIRVEQDPRSERARLEMIYGDVIVTKGNAETPPVYPGRNPSMVMEAPEYERAVGDHWMNPLTGEREIITETGSILAPRGPLVRGATTSSEPLPTVQTFGDPRPGNPDTGETRSKRSAPVRDRPQKYDDSTDSPFGG
jgi:hypothetical protein